MVRRSAVSNDPKAQTGLTDLESVQRLIGSPVLIAVFDIPWTPVFLAGIALHHPLLGLLAIVGGSTLVLITLLNKMFSRGPMLQANINANKASQMSDEIRNEAEMVQSMGMRSAAFKRWVGARDESLAEAVTANDVSGSCLTVSKTLRLFLQSAMLGLGAYLVLQNELTPGAMIAASILLGRALAPIELAIGQWAMVQRAMRGWSSLAELLEAVPPEAPRTALPKPQAKLSVQALTVIPPGEKRASLKNVSFKLKPGQAVGVIGPSAAGKSTLARALTGVWRPAGGSVRLDGVALEQFDPDVLATILAICRNGCSYSTGP